MMRKNFSKTNQLFSLINYTQILAIYMSADLWKYTRLCEGHSSCAKLWQKQEEIERNESMHTAFNLTYKN
jgi:hypothetical protein